MSTEISVLESINPVEVFKAGGIDSILSAIREEVVHDIPNTETAKGRKEIASRAYKVRQSKTYLDKKGKELADQLNAQLKPINAERKKARDQLDALADELREPLTAWEDAEKERIAGHESAIRDMQILSQAADEFGEVRRAETLAANLAELELIAMGEHWEEFALQAMTAKESAIATLKGHIEVRQKYEAEQAELERLRAEAVKKEQEERDARIAKEASERAEREASERAKAEAERVEREKVAAAQKAQAEADRIEQGRLQAIRDKEAAEARAIAQKAESERAAKEAAERAERDRIESIERERRLGEEREAARIRHEQQVKAEAEEVERQRVANTEHRRTVNNEILAAMISNGIDESVAKNIISLSAKGMLGRLNINY